MPALILTLTILGLGLLWLARRRRMASGLPSGRLIYLDAGQLGRVDDVLYDAQLDLAGKPDFIVSSAAGTVPVEVKSGRAPLQPHESHVIQLAAYCHLAQARYGRRPGYGVLKYADRAFAVDYTPALEARLLEVLGQLRRAQHQQPGRSHNAAGRCHACGYRAVCDQRLD